MTQLLRLRTATTICISLLLAACSTTPTGTPPGARLIEPNANLRLHGIPPLPASTADEVAKYTDFRGHRFVDWHPLRREMLVPIGLQRRWRS